jgi:isopropylmalate/homocitrate/citramalate synthase
VQEIAVFGAASETFTMKNTNCDIKESISRFKEISEVCIRNGIRIRGYVSCVMGCPYEGEVKVNKVNYVAKRLLELGCYEISLGDTIGAGNILKCI